MAYQLLNQKANARLGILQTRRGDIETPCFMPIATKGGVKAITVEDLKTLNPQIILSNTYHLMLRPGEGEIKQLGGLHALMNWDKPILTDSGGFQVFSLAKIRKLSEAGVIFNSHLDGKQFFMSPEDSIKIQMTLDSDIMMVLDECVALPAKREYIEKSVELTTNWAKQCNAVFCHPELVSVSDRRPLLFAIVQGGLEKDLRIKSARDLVKIGFDGYAIGGLSVGETEQEMCSVLDYVCDELPKNKLRYLMGVGYPEQIVEAVKRGIDMFDCVIPTREARHGRLFIMNNELGIMNNAHFYQKINIKSERFQFDKSPINAKSQFAELRNNTKAYLRHLFVVEDPTAQRLATLNNLEFYLNLMQGIREEIKRDK